MFHFAEPEEPGLGVTILTPGLTRSSQPLMPLGLPLRTTIATTDWVTTPLLGPDFQSSATSFSSTSLVTSGSSDKWTSSASSPAMTARLWSPDAPYEVLKVTSLPASVFWKSLRTCSLAVFRTEKPTTLTSSDLLLPPPAVAHPVRATSPATTPARGRTAAVFHVIDMCLDFLRDRGGSTRVTDY